MAHHLQLMTAIEDGDASLAEALIKSNHLHALSALEQLFADGDVTSSTKPRRRRRKQMAVVED
jgi:DNA-binding GntR family transcriptional regulator